jgi:uncharacterized protein
MLPKFIDPIKLAKNNQILQGTARLNEFPRLKENTPEGGGEFFVDLFFRIDLSGTVLVEGEIKAELSIICQRCFEPMVWKLVLPINLALLRREVNEDDLPESFEPIMLEELYFQSQRQNEISLLDLIEDECILAVPLVALHETEACLSLKEAKSPVDSSQKQAEISDKNEIINDNPFSVLAQLNDKG